MIRPDAILEACVILVKRLDDVWIEEEVGVKIVGAAQLAEYCQPEWPHAPPHPR